MRFGENAFMFQKKTTIVIGAGASKEVGLPIGNELKSIISSKLDIKFDDYGTNQESGSYEILSAIRSIARSNNEQNLKSYIDACWKIRDAMPMAISIDNFIDAHRGDKVIELCGKLAIASSILEAESNSSLYIDRSNIYNKINFGSIEKTWFNSFLQLITENCSAEDLDSRLSTITLIIFNYDRCIEHYLYHALQNYYSISKERASDLINRIEIYHPYGSLGDLPLFNSNGIEFGTNGHTEVLKEISSKLKTFTEGTDPNSSEIVEIRKAVASCDILLFLGFSYQKQNLKLIKPIKEEQNSSVSSICYGTSLGLSHSSRERIVDELSSFSNLSKENISLENMTCARLFHEYWWGLSWD